MTVDVSKTIGYAALKPRDIYVSKSAGYAVLKPKRQDVSKLVAYFVLAEGPPDPFNTEIRLSYAAAYAVMVPGTNGPVSYASSLTADALIQTTDRLRVTHRSVEVAHTTKGQARVSGQSADALVKAAAAARIGALNFEVLRSTAEVTVQGLITAAVVDVVYTKFGSAMTTQIYAEVLMTAGIDGEDFGTVAVLN